MSVLLSMFNVNHRSKHICWPHIKRNLLVVAGLLSVFFCPSLLAEMDIIAPERQKEIANMVLQDCGSCHGMSLKGGLGPALTPEAIGDKHEDMLAGTILYGRSGTAMPPWKTFLNEREARWIVKQLKLGAIKK